MDFILGYILGGLFGFILSGIFFIICKDDDE